VLAFTFAHKGAAIALFEKAGFAPWGLLSCVALLAAIERALAIIGQEVA
jgi:hypothetical protein